MAGNLSLYTYFRTTLYIRTVILPLKYICRRTDCLTATDRSFAYLESNRFRAYLVDTLLPWLYKFLLLSFFFTHWTAYANFFKFNKSSGFLETFLIAALSLKLSFILIITFILSLDISHDLVNKSLVNSLLL